MNTQCAIAGGGPAGMMLGYLLARAGVSVVVLEKHVDFLRDFRGDTVHPSTLEIMHELGILEEFLQRPHQKVPQLRGWVGQSELTIADFTALPTHCKFLVLMPQWEFLDFLAQKAKAFPSFQLIMEAEVTDLLQEGIRVRGLRVTTPQGPLEIQAGLVVGADGRCSIVREKAGLTVNSLGAPIDALWLQLSRKPTDPNQTFGRFDRGKVMAILNRGDYWQCAYVIRKGQIEGIRQKGLEAFRAGIAELIPFFRDRVQELQDWDQIKLLTVLVDRLESWYKPGLLCIGDAAHAMSPIGGVGINLAIQDAVAAANKLASPLKNAQLQTVHLAAVQQRRLWPTQVIQEMQVFAQNNIFGSALSAGGWKTLPWPLRVLRRFPSLARLSARLIGLGVRPEHIKL